MEKLDDVVNEYLNKKSSLDQYELAEYERRIWALYQPGGKKGLQRDWMHKRFGGSQHEYELRQTLLSAGSVAQPLWVRISKGMPVSTTLRLFRDAKRQSVEKDSSLDDALSKTLNDYDKLDNIYSLSGGKVVRKASPFGSRTVKITAEPSGIRELKGTIRSLVDRHSDSTFSDLEIDPYEAKQAKEELIDWVNEGLDSFQKRVNKIKTSTKEEQLYTKIGRTKFSHAIEILGLSSSEFRFGKPINLKKAKKAYFERAKMLHPDRNEGLEVIEYQAVVEAFKLLEQYADQIGVEK